jgi:catechol 2,3-dioxygenase-like lactoylglutathione lyase family enzyme
VTTEGPRPADESLWDALVLVEHAWRLADEERFGALGPEDGWAIVDELGFTFTSLRAAVVSLRPKLRTLTDLEYDHLVDGAISERFVGTAPADEPKPYILDLLRQAKTLLVGATLTLEYEDFLTKGRMDRMAALREIEDASEHPDTALYALDPDPLLQRAARLCHTTDMTIKRLDHVSVVVDDLAAAIAFFTALGLTLEGEMPVEGPWVDRVNGLESVQVDIVMMRTPDGHGRLELTKFRNPELVEIEPAIAPPNTLGLRSVMFTVESVDDTVARLRANGAELVGEVAQYEDMYRLCYMRGPAGIIVALAEELF